MLKEVLKSTLLGYSNRDMFPIGYVTRACVFLCLLFLYVRLCISIVTYCPTDAGFEKTESLHGLFMFPDSHTIQRGNVTRLFS